MRAQTIDSSPPGDQLLTTGEAARILNTSRQHIVDLCNRGDLAFDTTGRHRRIRRDDVEALRARTHRLTRDQIRSLWLGYAIAGKIVADPQGALKKASENLAHLERVHGAGNRWLREWRSLLEGPVTDVLDALVSRSPRARELRQNSPFAGLLSDEERHLVLQAFTSDRAGARS